VKVRSRYSCTLPKVTARMMMEAKGQVRPRCLRSWQGRRAVLRRGALAATSSLLVIGFAAACATAPLASNVGGDGSKVIASGRSLSAVLGDGGDVAVVGGGGGNFARIGVWRDGTPGLDPVGRGGRAFAVSEAGDVAYECGLLSVCVMTDGDSRTSARRIPLPCARRTIVAKIAVADDLKSLIAACQVPHTLERLDLNARHAAFQRIATRPVPAEWRVAPDAISANGSVAIIESSGALSGETDEEGTLQLYRGGALTPVAGVTEFQALSRNGRYMVASEGYKEPLVIDLDDDARTPIPRLTCAIKGSIWAGGPWAVTDSGDVVFGIAQRCAGTSRYAIERANIRTGEATEIVKQCVACTELQTSSSGNVILYVDGGPTADTSAVVVDRLAQ
jgi:hypothetical protein